MLRTSGHEFEPVTDTSPRVAITPRLPRRQFGPDGSIKDFGIRVGVDASVGVGPVSIQASDASTDISFVGVVDHISTGFGAQP